nr:phosphomannomutase CpsG [Providencia stuartii]ELR5084300.1 phosphomannomutase CpsG [Providencia stuartii]
MNKLTCFKAYDIRGVLGQEINQNIAKRIGNAYGVYIRPKTVVLGGDSRLSSPLLKASLAEGLLDAGVNVLDIDLSGTEEVYFATKHLGLDGGIQVTASHNPINYNGMKLVREEACPISGDTGLFDIQKLAESDNYLTVEKRGKYKKIDVKNEYVDHILNFIDIDSLKPLRLVINSGNGAAGPIIDLIEQKFNKLNIPITFFKINNSPDGNFPNGIPNPLLPECRSETSKAVRKYNADLGIAFDGDFDRCFFFDNEGNFIEGYYVVGLLAKNFLEKNPGQKIIHDPRLFWNTTDLVKQSGGIPIITKTGHAFIKERMRSENAIYGGEMSAHHYFRDFSYCDSGMIPWLIIIELISRMNTPLANLINDRINLFPVSGEINIKLDNPNTAIFQIEEYYKNSAVNIDKIDGLSMSFNEWRFNLRTSNTENILRLNVESKNKSILIKEKTQEILNIINKDS